jgi:hypothetical protein
VTRSERGSGKKELNREGESERGRISKKKKKKRGIQKRNERENGNKKWIGKCSDRDTEKKRERGRRGSDMENIRGKKKEKNKIGRERGRVRGRENTRKHKKKKKKKKEREREGVRESMEEKIGQRE